MKNVYVITIFNNNFVIQYDGNNILLFGTSHGKTLDQIESSVCDYIEHELRYYNGNVSELRIFLIKLQYSQVLRLHLFFLFAPTLFEFLL